jgi:hypothetical protein
LSNGGSDLFNWTVGDVPGVVHAINVSSLTLIDNYIAILIQTIFGFFCDLAARCLANLNEYTINIYLRKIKPNL